MIHSDKRIVIKHHKKRNEKINHPFIIKYLDYLKSKNVSSGRLKKMQTDSKRFLNWLCNYREFESYDMQTLPLLLVKKEHLIEYKGFLMNKEKLGEFSLYGFKNHFKNVKTLFKCLYQLDLLASDITVNITNILLENRIDAAVWNFDEIRSVQHFKSVDFQSEKAKILTKKTSEATIVIDTSRSEVLRQLSLLDTEIVLNAQMQVETGERFPHY